MAVVLKQICNTCSPSFVCTGQNEVLQHLIDNPTHGLVETQVWVEG